MAIPVLALQGTVLDATDPYDDGTVNHGGIFAPANPATTLEVLNGGLTSAEYTGGTSSIPPWACQTGSFVEAIHLPFEEWVLVYGLQLTAAELGAVASARIIPITLSTSFFLPWDAEMVEIDFHCYARQDASEWEALLTRFVEYWDIAVYYDGEVQQAVYVRYPQGRSYLSGPDVSPLVYYDAATPGPKDGDQQMAANRWRWTDVTFAFVSGSDSAKVAKGFHTLRLTTWAYLETPDPQTAKLLLPSGGVSVVAYRA